MDNASLGGVSSHTLTTPLLSENFGNGVDNIKKPSTASGSMAGVKVAQVSFTPRPSISKTMQAVGMSIAKKVLGAAAKEVSKLGKTMSAGSGSTAPVISSE